jgi:DNA-binding MarR family transcriptional regulator
MPEIFPAAGGPEDPGGDVALEVGDLIASVSRRIRRAANRDLGPLGITWSQLRALRTVAGSDGAVRMSDLADRLGIARRSATSVVDDLVTLGLVERRADPHDRRAVDVAVTPKAHRLLRRLHDRRRSAAREVTAALSPADLARLAALLRRLDEDPRSL